MIILDTLVVIVVIMFMFPMLCYLLLAAFWLIHKFTTRT